MNMHYQANPFDTREIAVEFARKAADDWMQLGFVRFWTLGPGRDRSKTGDDNCRRTADGIMRTRGWLLQTVSDAYQHGADKGYVIDHQPTRRAFEPPKPPKRTAASKARSMDDEDGDSSLAGWRSPPRIGRDRPERFNDTDEDRKRIFAERFSGKKPTPIAEILYS